MIRKLVGVSTSALLTAALLIGVPSPAYADSRQSICWGGSPADGGECVRMKTNSGWQADGSGVYLDSIEITCIGGFEDDPAVDGYDLTVNKLSRRGRISTVYHHPNPNIYQEGDGWCNKRIFMTSVKRKKGYRFHVFLEGKARRDLAPDRVFLLSIWVGGLPG